MYPPPAAGDPVPANPLPGRRPHVTPRGDFGAKRSPRKPDYRPRWHPGIDLAAPEGAPVVAMETGRVVAVHGWDGEGTRALLVQGDSGLVVVYGAVAPIGLPPLGTRVYKGQQIATVGVYPNGSTMLHLECWREGTTQHVPWFADAQPPYELLDPRPYYAASVASIVFDDAEAEPVTPWPDSPSSPVTPWPDSPSSPSSSTDDGGSFAGLALVAALLVLGSIE